MTWRQMGGAFLILLTTGCATQRAHSDSALREDFLRKRLHPGDQVVLVMNNHERHAITVTEIRRGAVRAGAESFPIAAIDEVEKGGEPMLGELKLMQGFFYIQLIVAIAVAPWLITTFFASF